MGDLLRSEELRRLTVGPAAAGMAAPLQELQQFTDWEQAAELGRIVPHSGADRAFDDADARVRSAPCMREEPLFHLRIQSDSPKCAYIKGHKRRKRMLLQGSQGE